MRIRYTTASDESDYFVNDAFPAKGEPERWGPYTSLKSAEAARNEMNADWLQEVVDAKDTLFRSGVLSLTENHRLNSKLDRETKQSYVMKRQWRIQ